MKKNFWVELYMDASGLYFDDAMTKSLMDSLPEMIRFYGDVNADGLLIHMFAKTDEEKEETLKLLKEITAISEIPVTTTFPIKRVEDVKKLLYANSKKVVLNLSDASNWDMLEEVSKRFGKEKIAVTLDDFSTLPIYHKMAEEYADEIIIFDGTKAKNISEHTTLPCIISMPDVMPERLLEALAEENVCGIIGKVVNDNIKDINALKSLCMERNIPVNALAPSISFKELVKNSDGLVPVIVQDYKTNEVLMMAYMNEEAYNLTLKTGKMNYYSRSRKSQWEKGESSGHFQYVKSLYADCDSDTILAKVSQVGVACHTGSRSCFFKEIVAKPYEEKNPLKVFEEVYGVIADRKVNPKEGSYTNYLFDKGIDKILKKVGEEASEIIIASKNPESGEIKYEIADFLYHCMVLMVEKEITWEEITTELANR